MTRWLAGLPMGTRAKVVEIGLLDRERAAVGKPLSEHVADWSKTLEAKGNTPAYVTPAVGRVQRIIDGCGLRFFSEITGAKVAEFLRDRRDGAEERGISSQTSNYYLGSLRPFCRWMVRERRALESPVSHLSGLNAKLDRRGERRPFSADELRRLLQEANTGMDFGGVTGPARAMLYRLAVETGLRAGELRSLTRASFDLDAAAVTVLAAHSKRRRDDSIPLRPWAGQGPSGLSGVDSGDGKRFSQCPAPKT